MSEIKALQEIIDMLEADDISTSAVLKLKYDDYRRYMDMKNFEEADRCYYAISGFLWGLEACKYISEDRRNRTINKVINYGK